MYSGPVKLSWPICDDRLFSYRTPVWYTGQEQAAMRSGAPGLQGNELMIALHHFIRGMPAINGQQG